MRIRVAFVCLVVLLAAATSRAQTPTPGGGKDTIQVLSNQLTALQAQVAALAAQVASMQAGQAPLEARVAKLESGQVDAADLVGTYMVQALGLEMLGAPARIMTEAGLGTVTFHGDGTLTYSGKDVRVTLRQGTPWTTSYAEAPESGTSTWWVADGKLFLGSDDEAVIIGAGGRVLFGGGGSPTSGWNNIFLMFRIPNQ